MGGLWSLFVAATLYEAAPRCKWDADLTAIDSKRILGIFLPIFDQI
jgi:hypothetical protein